MAPKLYYKKMSPPCRAVLMVIKAIDLEIELEEVESDFMKSSEMLKLNPQHTVPTFVDDDFVICDSHVIAGYLIGQYGPNDSLYPQDIQKRALVDEKLHFEGSVLFSRLAKAFLPIWKGATEIDEEAREKIIEAYGFLDAFLDGHDYLVGDDLTIADLSNFTTTVSLDLIIPVDEETFPNLYGWVQRCKELPYFEETNQEDLDMIKAIILEKLSG